MVYGPDHEEMREEFLLELAQFCSDMNKPYIVGGDFNILRHGGEKNKKLHDHKSIDMFNSVINSYGLREIYYSGGKYTRTNNHTTPPWKR